MSDVDEQNDGTQHSNHVVFKRNIKHSFILLEVSNNQSNDSKLQNIQFWYPVSHIHGLDLKDVTFFKLNFLVYFILIFEPWIFS